MIRYLVKNYFKMMSRSMTNVLLLIICPLILIALLSSAFHDLMAHYEDEGNLSFGYSVEGNLPDAVIDGVKQMADEQGITLHEYANRDPEDAMKHDDLAGFVVFADDTYTIYQDKDHETEGKVLEYAMSVFYEQLSLGQFGRDPMTSNNGLEKPWSEPTIETPDFMPEPDSVDYYGIVEIVYFGWCAIVCGAAIFISEKKYKIRRKLEVSSLTQPKLYLAKFLPIVAVVYLSALITMGASAVLFGVHFGNLPLTLLILLFSVMAATALGLMVYGITDNMVATIIIVFIVVWFMGFFGGAFETYIYTSLPESMKLWSPIYHINRSIVELSVMNKSDYVASALSYAGGITVGCSLLAILAGTLRKRGKA